MTDQALGKNSGAFLPGVSGLARKLSRFMPLSDADRRALDAVLLSEEQFPADADIVAEGRKPRSLFLLQAGMAVRYRNLPDGGRQIITFLIPGDLCNPHMFLLRTMDHSIGTLTPVRLAAISQEGLMDIFASRPRVSAALWWSWLQEESMLHERIVSLGRRDAWGRIAYLLCELLWRYETMGLTKEKAYHLPLTQTELGDTLGLTPVHVNRVLKDLRERRLISIESRLLKVLDVVGLQEIAGFNKDYLHLDGASDDVIRYFDRSEARLMIGERRPAAGEKAARSHKADGQVGSPEIP